MKSLEQAIDKPFSSPTEELEFLRAKVLEKEQELKEQKIEIQKEKVAHTLVKEYSAVNDAAILSQSHKLEQAEAEAIVLDLDPENHDDTMSELLAILLERGLKNALTVAAKLDNPHLEDDFHRFLAAYITKGLTVKETGNQEVFKALHMKLYEVALQLPQNEPQKPLKELLSSMEQLYAGLLSIKDDHSDEPAHLSIELANANGSHEFVLYIAIPNSKAALFEKQTTALFPGIKLTPSKNDYNIFSEKGYIQAARAKLSQNAIFPIKTYEKFDIDPILVIINSLTKLAKDGEGASIQFIVRPPRYEYNKKFQDALTKIQKGEKVSEAINIPFGVGMKVIHYISDAFKPKKKDKEGKEVEPEKEQVDAQVVERIQHKLSSHIADVGIRLVVSAQTEQRAHAIMDEISAAFNQFEQSGSNELTWNILKGRAVRDCIEGFTYRLEPTDTMPLSIKELTTLMHIPQTKVSAAQLRQNRSVTAPAPFDAGTHGVVLGTNAHEGQERTVHFSTEDRLRHLYVIGQTGTGKTSLLKQLIIQDIQNGEGVCFIDPHGSDVQDILSHIPKERYEDVIYFDPSHTARPMGLNMLEFDRNFPEQKTFVVNEMLSIFNKLFDMKTAGGPMFEQYFRNAVMLVLEDPDSGATLLDVSRVLASKSYREMKLTKSKNPIVNQFWREVADKAGGEASLQNIVPYITSKFDVFLSNDIMRPIVAQQTSAFNFRDVMDKKKILLVNLAKGRLGDINAHLLGLILVGKILMASLSRVDSFGKDLPPFFLYIDEFQNVTTDSISTILSEARKYKLSLTVAHQFIAQLEEKIKDAVFGNVGSMAVFRVGTEDAEIFEKQFAPEFKATDVSNLDNFNAYTKMLMNGKPVRPFNIRTLIPTKGNKDQVEPLKELSHLTYGKDRALVEQEITDRYS